MIHSTPARAVGVAVVLLLGVLGLQVAATPALAAPEQAAKEAPQYPWCGEPPDPCDCNTCECRKPSCPKCPTKYHNLRFEEDWSACLSVPCYERKDWTDAWKAVGCGPRSSIWANFGGQIRFRYEGWVHQAFNDTPVADDAWGLFRLRAHADVHFCNLFRVFVEGIYADQWERDLGPRPIDRNRGDLLNAFAEIYGGCGSWKGLLRAGRMELQEGRQRLVSPLDWANTRRTFQGALGRIEWGNHRLDVWATQPVRILPTEFDEGNDDVAFYGAYYTNRDLTCLTWELYFMGLNREPGTYLGVTANEDRYTVGGRVGGDIPGTRLDFDVEAAGQFGTFGNVDIGAFMAVAELGWRPEWTCWQEWIGVGFDYASGNDDDATTLGTFNQLFPLGHAYFGYADLIGRQNIVAARVTAKVKPTKSTTLRADYHYFSRASEFDAVYHAGGGVLRAPVAGVTSLPIGTELDLSFVWKVDRHWRVTGGWCHFFAGEFIDLTGPNEDADFFWLEAQWTF